MEQGPGCALLANEVLGVDKVLAVCGRAEARDVMDLMAVEDENGLSRLLALAAEKDRGFDPMVFVEMTARFDRLRRDDQVGKLALAAGGHLLRDGCADCGHFEWVRSESSTK